MSKKWLTSQSLSYFKFIAELAKKSFVLNDKLSQEETLLATMLHYDFWQAPGGFSSLAQSIKSIGKNSTLVDEIIELLEILHERIDYSEHDIDLGYTQALKVHSRYSRDQILCAFGENRFDKKSSSREGVLSIVDKNTELLFVTLEKTEEKYSPTTMYDDYALSETLFHWQSQNSSRSDRGRGLSYITHQENNKNILLFVREKNVDTFNNTLSYVFLGKVFYKEHQGSKPMSITWKLEKEIPPFLWKEIAKMAVG
ncbi:MAG: DUF3427 domain-containing protein [Campylobacterales bacterium]|nr:DUF3427 domain-containing protein [Campylobacterales bacterium]